MPHCGSIQEVAIQSFADPAVEEHPDGRKAIVPVHGGETIGPGLLVRILKTCERGAEQLRQLSVVGTLLGGPTPWFDITAPSR